MKQMVMLLAAAALCCGKSFALDPDTGIAVKASGFAYYQFGQIEKTYDGGLTSGLPDKVWDQRFVTRFTLDATVRERLRVVAGAELGLITNPNNAALISSFVPKEAQGIYTFGDNPKSKTPPLQIAVGYFPFKYDPSATNFGEYLFSCRAGAYPPYFVTDFANCQSRLLGLRASSWILDPLRFDMLFTGEQTVKPYGDYSLAFLAGYKLQSLINCGAGVSFYRLFPISASQTTPSIDSPYTMQAVKIMARCSFDPKPLLPEEFSRMFGAQDMKLYGEAAILGLKNYGAVYDTLWQRMPVMIGFEFPTFKLLDMLSLEGEYFASPFIEDIPKSPTPIPVAGTDQFSNQSKVHWSVWAQKTVIPGFVISGLAGKDHFRYLDAGGNPTEGEMLRANGDWHYNVRFMFSF